LYFEQEKMRYIKTPQMTYPAQGVLK